MKSAQKSGPRSEDLGPHGRFRVRFFLELDADLSAQEAASCPSIAIIIVIAERVLEEQVRVLADGLVVMDRVPAVVLSVAVSLPLVIFDAEAKLLTLCKVESDTSADLCELPVAVDLVNIVEGAPEG